MTFEVIGKSKDTVEHMTLWLLTFSDSDKPTDIERSCTRIGTWDTTYTWVNTFEIDSLKSPIPLSAIKFLSRVWDVDVRINEEEAK